MAYDRRVSFIHKWLRRATDTKDADAFDRFFSVWIALVVAAQRVRDASGGLADEDSDRQRVVDYFLVRKASVIRAVERHAVEMNWIAHRRGTGYGNAILDTGNQDLHRQFTKLSKHYLASEPMQDDELVKTLAEFLNKVRNNLFHGAKVYDDQEDRELLERVNPVLLAILEESEGEVAHLDGH